jgi:Transmembrane secretion effector
MPNRVRGRVNATVIMISQGAITLGSVIWGSAAAVLGAGTSLFTAAVLFLMTLLLSRRLSINFVVNPEERVLGVLSITEDPMAPTSRALTALKPA